MFSPNRCSIIGNVLWFNLMFSPNRCSIIGNVLWFNLKRREYAIHKLSMVIVFHYLLVSTISLYNGICRQAIKVGYSSILKKTINVEPEEIKNAIIYLHLIYTQYLGTDMTSMNYFNAIITSQNKFRQNSNFCPHDTRQSRLCHNTKTY